MLIKTHYCYEGKLQGNFVVSPLILSLGTMNLQQIFFKCTMKANVIVAMEPPFHVNSFIRLWWTLSIFWVLNNCFLEIFKSVEIDAIQVLGSVEDEHTFSTLSFMKSKLQNKLWEHLPTIMGMFSQPFSHYNFSTWCHI